MDNFGLAISGSITRQRILLEIHEFAAPMRCLQYMHSLSRRNAQTDCQDRSERTMLHAEHRNLPRLQHLFHQRCFQFQWVLVTHHITPYWQTFVILSFSVYLLHQAQTIGIPWHFDVNWCAIRIRTISNPNG